MPTPGHGRIYFGRGAAIYRCPIKFVQKNGCCHKAIILSLKKISLTTHDIEPVPSRAKTNDLTVKINTDIDRIYILRFQKSIHKENLYNKTFEFNVPNKISTIGVWRKTRVDNIMSVREM